MKPQFPECGYIVPFCAREQGDDGAWPRRGVLIVSAMAVAHDGREALRMLAGRPNGNSESIVSTMQRKQRAARCECVRKDPSTGQIGSPLLMTQPTASLVILVRSCAPAHVANTLRGLALVHN